MKILLTSVASVLISFSLHAQTPLPHDSVFRSGTFFGKSYPEIKDARIFGEPASTRASIGRFNVPFRLEFHDTFNTRNPYSTEIGFDHQEQVAYFLIRKRTLAQGQRLEDGEILPMLVKVARGGDWKLISKPEEDNLLYEYSHVYKKMVGDTAVPEETFKAFAYIPNNRQFVFAYTPFVSPNLAELDASRSFRFAGGPALALGDGAGALGDQDSTDSGSVTFIDAPVPPELAKQLESKAPESRRLALDALNDLLEKSAATGSPKTYLVLGSQVKALEDALAISKRAGNAAELPRLASPAFAGLDGGTLKSAADAFLQKLEGHELK